MKSIIIFIIFLQLTNCKSIIEIKNITKLLIQPNQFKNFMLNANTLTKMNIGDKISIQCPLPDFKAGKFNRDTTHYNKKKSTPIFITTWYKNKIKINQFFDEEFNHIKIFEDKIKINGLISSDSGVYFCEIIMGTGINIRSSNLTLQVNDFQYGKLMLKN